MLNLHCGLKCQRPYSATVEYFGQIFEKISAIRFADLSNGAAFELDASSKRMTMNIGHVEAMWRAANSDLHRTGQQASTRQLSPDEVPRLLRKTVNLLILHEVSHIRQGIADYEKVQALKSVKLEGFIGDLDLIADINAGRGYALLECIETENESILGYLQNFAQALFFGGLYCFPAFGVPADKPHKVTRALGSTLMLARYVLAERDGKIELEHSGSLPLDTPLIPRIGDDFSSLTIFALTPELEVHSQFTGLDAALLRNLCAKLDSNFIGALEDCISLLRGGLRR